MKIKEAKPLPREEKIKVPPELPDKIKNKKPLYIYIIILLSASVLLLLLYVFVINKPNHDDVSPIDSVNMNNTTQPNEKQSDLKKIEINNNIPDNVDEKNMTAELRELIIRNVRDKYNTIKSMNLTSYNAASLGCAEIVYKLNGNEVMTASISRCLGDGCMTDEYTFYDGQLIFVYSVTESSSALETTTHRTEQRYYYWNNKRVICKEDNNFIKCGNENDEGYMLKEAYKSKDFEQFQCD